MQDRNSSVYSYTNLQQPSRRTHQPPDYEGYVGPDEVHRPPNTVSSTAGENSEYCRPVGAGSDSHTYRIPEYSESNEYELNEVNKLLSIHF